MSETAEEKRARKQAKNAALPLGLRTTAIEVYGPPGHPRMRWTCPHCAGRNDSRIELPVAPRTTQRCAFCHAGGSTFRFTPVEGAPDGIVRTIEGPPKPLMTEPVETDADAIADARRYASDLRETAAGLAIGKVSA